MNRVESVVSNIRRALRYCWNFCTGRKEKTQFGYNEFPDLDFSSPSAIDEEFWHDRDRYSFNDTNSPYIVQSPLFSVRNTERLNSVPIYRVAEPPNEEQVVIQRSFIKRGRGTSVTSIYRHR